MKNPCGYAFAFCRAALRDARALRKLHGWCTIAWFLATPAIWMMPEAWRVQYVIFLSQYALVLSHWAAWQATRVEVKQDDAAAKET